jgi:Mg-chelatase subunit ChlD
LKRPSEGVDATPPHAPLAHWLRLLWGRAPGLRFDAETPFLSAGTLHLAPQGRWREHRAAAAHAAAHLAYSPPRFDGRGLAPIARAVLALLEDARVEALAGRELPGLRRLWLPLHTALPDDGNGFETLLARLARALADPEYADAHPWVRKGRRLFYLDDRQQMMALRTPAELRQAATRLGHDIGQMRLPFNARLYRPVPHYRDDHRWMWAADDLSAAEPPHSRPDGDEADHAVDDAATLTRHPEWDRLIARLRPNWCSVIEQPVPETGTPPSVAPDIEEWGRRLRRPLQPLARPATARGRSADGDAFDLDALVDWRMAQRLRLAPDVRVYRGRRHQPARAAVWVLVDQSASTAAAHGGGRTVLQAAAQSAAALARTLQSLGVRCAVAGFQSSGRHAVRLHTVKALDTPLDEGLAARLQALRPGGSTRLGAALRHAALRLGAWRGGARWVLLLSDGQPHDIDVHDPRYLVEDARHAVRQAARRSVRMACLTLAREVDADARRIFGRGAQSVDRLDALPRAMQRLLV